MSTYRFQKAFARKREADHVRTERTSAVDLYYNHWGKQTSKFQNWTTPEYYEKAEEKLKKSKEKKENAKQLEVRREKLRLLLSGENTNFQEQIATLRRPKSRNMNVNDMEKIDQHFKARQDQKRSLELEAKLYGRWRHGVDDGNILFESKTNNQALAKLNWLDKQIEDKVQREEDEKNAQERTLLLQEEVRKTEQHHKERQVIREKEITEIRALQEKHMQELKVREHEAEALKSEANFLNNSIENLTVELDSLEHKRNSDKDESPSSHNLRNIKMTIRKRSQEFRDKLKSDIDLLRRVNGNGPSDTTLGRFINKLQEQWESEKKNLAQIEGMYESEAKINLNQCEEAWRQLNYERHLNLTHLLMGMRINLSNKFDANQQRQKDLIDIRATHLSSIENSNDRLKLLIREHDESPRPLVIETPRVTPEQDTKSLPKISSSFSNLNLDCEGGGELGSQPQSARSQMVVTPDSANGPKFGRKRVAWM